MSYFAVMTEGGQFEDRLSLAALRDRWAAGANVIGIKTADGKRYCYDRTLAALGHDPYRRIPR